MLRLCGAELREVPAVPYKDPNNYVKWPSGSPRSSPKRSRTASSTPTSGTTRPTATATTHDRPRDLGADRRPGGRLRLCDRHRRDARGRRRRSSRSEAATCGSSRPTRWAPRMYHWFKHGELKSEGSSITEGIGQGRVTGNVEGAPWTRPTRSPTRRRSDPLRSAERGGALPRRLERDQRGGSDPARARLGPGHTMVTVLGDSRLTHRSSANPLPVGTSRAPGGRCDDLPPADRPRDLRVYLSARRRRARVAAVLVDPVLEQIERDCALLGELGLRLRLHPRDARPRGSRHGVRAAAGAPRREASERANARESRNADLGARAMGRRCARATFGSRCSRTPGHTSRMRHLRVPRGRDGLHRRCAPRPRLRPHGFPGRGCADASPLGPRADLRAAGRRRSCIQATTTRAAP